MRFLILFAYLVVVGNSARGEIKTLGDMSNYAKYVAKIEMTRVLVLSDGSQQIRAKIEEQFTGRPLASDIVIYIDASEIRRFRVGKYLAFLEGPERFGFVPSMNAAMGFAEIRDRTVYWRERQFALSAVLAGMSRLGIGL